MEKQALHRIVKRAAHNAYRKSALRYQIKAAVLSNVKQAGFFGSIINPVRRAGARYLELLGGGNKVLRGRYRDAMKQFSDAVAEARKAGDYDLAKKLVDEQATFIRGLHSNDWKPGSESVLRHLLPGDRMAQIVDPGAVSSEIAKATGTQLGTGLAGLGTLGYMASGGSKEASVKRAFSLAPPPGGWNNAAMGAILGGVTGFGTEAASDKKHKDYLKSMIMSALIGGGLGLASSYAGLPDMWKKTKPYLTAGKNRVVGAFKGAVNP